MSPKSALLCVCLLFGASLGCKSEPAQTTACAETDAGAPVDPALLAFLSRARSAHARADTLEDDGQVSPAIRELERIVHGPLPSGTERAEVREVLADTRARLADLRSRTGAFDEAERDVKAGLELARETSYFRGHLFEVRGLLEQRRHDRLRAGCAAADAGTARPDAGQLGAAATAAPCDAAAATAAKLRALDAFEEAMRIQEEVIKKAVPAPPLKRLPGQGP